MDSLRPLLLTAVGLAGTFWGGFAEVLNKAAIPTTPQEFGMAFASLVLLLLPVAVQWLFRKFLPKPASDEALELLHEMHEAVKRSHRPPDEPAATLSDAV